MILSIAAASIFVTLQGCGSGAKEANAIGNYHNPILRQDCPDPSILDNRSRDGWFYLYSTQSGTDSDGSDRYLPVYRSRNLVNWEAVGDGFCEGRPTWSPEARNWAPDASWIDGKYVLYYAMGVWGNLTASASGVAVSDSPDGPFEDKGMIVSLANTGVTNSIDPDYFEDGGEKYLFWGSLGKGSGIWGVELSDDGLSIKPGSRPVKLAGENKEGACMYKHGGKYYLFASQGSCCEGSRSTYKVVAGRSGSPLGPFVSKSGISMLVTDNSYDQIVLCGSQDKTFAGPGHNAEIIEDDKGQGWMLYHSYWKGNGYEGRCLCLDKVNWDKDGWPEVNDGSPSSSSAYPTVK